MAAHVQDAAEGQDIRVVLLRPQVEEVLLDGDGRPRGVRTSDGEIPAEHVVDGDRGPARDGGRRGGGPRVGESGALRVDDHQRCPGARRRVGRGRLRRVPGTGCSSARSTCSSARTRTSRAASPASTRPAATCAFPGVARHRDLPHLPPRGRAHRAERARGRSGRHRRGRRRPSRPTRARPTSRARARSGSSSSSSARTGACSAPRSSASRPRASASTRSPPASGPA